MCAVVCCTSFISAVESQINSGVIEDLEEKLWTAEELLKASDDNVIVESAELFLALKTADIS